MATQRQIEANRKNSTLSTGPSADGLLRTRGNATKHGLAGEAASADSPEFVKRRAQWAAEFQPSGDAAGWALDRAVAASLRIERCEKHLQELRTAGQRRARLTWDEDRALEAAETFAQLARKPVVASRRLRTTAAGVELLMDAWVGLLSAMQEGRPWTEAEASRALDLLGVDPLCRSGRSPIDPLDGSDRETFRVRLVEAQLDRLEALRNNALAELDEADRAVARYGEADLMSKATQLALRYERDAWRRHDRAIAELRGHDVAAPGSTVAPPPTPKPQPTPSPSPSPSGSAGEAPPDEVAAYLAERGYATEAEWFEALERRHERAKAFAERAGRLVTDRSQFLPDRSRFAVEPAKLAS
jgi:hypothetical protein